MFQSSSGQKAGCNIERLSAGPGRSAFQSSSGQKAGCNIERLSAGPGRSAFQSSSGQKAGCNPEQPTTIPIPEAVSILIRPEGRMQHGRQNTHRHLQLDCFNPHPARRPDATTIKLLDNRDHELVSILIRPEGRMQHPKVYRLMQRIEAVSILIRPEGRMQRRGSEAPRH